MCLLSSEVVQSIGRDGAQSASLSPGFTVWRVERESRTRASLLHPMDILLAKEDKRDNQRVDGNGLGERQRNEHIDLDERSRLRVAPDCAERLTARDADADARSNGSQADCQSYTDDVDTATHD